MTDKEKIAKALDYASAVDGAHHKAWVIDQMVRALTGCPMVERSAKDYLGEPYTHETQGESDEYIRWVEEYCDGEHGSNTYSWDEGIAP